MYAVYHKCFIISISFSIMTFTSLSIRIHTVWLNQCSQWWSSLVHSFPQLCNPLWRINEAQTMSNSTLPGTLGTKSSTFIIFGLLAVATKLMDINCFFDYSPSLGGALDSARETPPSPLKLHPTWTEGTFEFKGGRVPHSLCRWSGPPFGVRTKAGTVCFLCSSLFCIGESGQSLRVDFYSTVLEYGIFEYVQWFKKIVIVLNVYLQRKLGNIWTKRDPSRFR